MATAPAADEKIKLQDMPAAVQRAVSEQSRGAVVRAYSKEVENGRISYEAELIIGRHSKDISFDETGKVVAVEEEVALETIPARAANQSVKRPETERSRGSNGCRRTV